MLSKTKQQCHEGESMKRLLGMVIVCVLFAGCNEEGSNPGSGDMDIGQIDAVRAQVMKSWQEFAPADQKHDHVILGFGDTTQSYDSSHDCEFVYSSAQFDSKYDAAGRVYRFQRTLDSYTLGAQTTATAAECATIANGPDDFASTGFSFQAALLLFLDKVNEKKETRGQIPGLDEVRPTQITKSQFNGYDVYRLTYFMKGHTSSTPLPMFRQISRSKDHEFSGTVSFVFAAGLPPSAWVWQSKWNLMIGDAAYVSSEQMVFNLNGVEIPLLDF
jgi:hypothetical protein